MQRANIKYLFACLIISLCLVSSCAYVETPQQPPSSPPPAISAPTNPEWTLPPSDGQSQLLPDFVSVVAKVRPSVVAINTEVVTLGWFNQPFTEEGAGSGWIVDKDGYIVTNNHVIEGAESITVTLVDGRALPAGIVGADALTDLAVLKVNEKNLPAAVVGDSSKLGIGEWVLAIGNALGMGISAKEGTISRLGATLTVGEGQKLYDLIETSAPVNPGNSGGPLVNMAGEVIGITSAKLAAVEVEGVGYAISSGSARPVIESLVQKGYVVRPWLGVVLETVNEWLAMRYDLAVESGAIIAGLVTNSPADKAGLKAGDIIVSVNGEEITSAEDLILAIHASKIGEAVEVTFWRGDRQQTTLVIPIESPPPS